VQLVQVLSVVAVPAAPIFVPTGHVLYVVHAAGLGKVAGAALKVPVSQATQV
jgi:hypothetical protein